MILTRYLYWKSQVLDALEAAMLLKSNDALFWAYELYFSGFEKETFNALFRLYHDLFSSLNPTMETFLQKKYKEWLKSKDDKIIAVVIKNLLTRPLCYDHYATPSLDKKEKEKENKKAMGRNIYVLVEEEEWVKYKTIQFEKPWKTLAYIASVAPPLRVYKEPHVVPNEKEYLDHWLYYASFSPCWKERIAQCGGTIHPNSKKIEWHDIEQEESFYEWYNYEPDEQTRTTRDCFIPANIQKVNIPD